MILAHMAAQYPEELTCDMAETYHVLDWRALGMALAGAKVPTETLLLGQAADALQLLLWTKTKDAQHGRNRPAPLVPTLLGRVQECETAGFADGAAYEAARARILRSV